MQRGLAGTALILAAAGVAFTQTAGAQNFSYPLVSTASPGTARPFIWIAGSLDPTATVHAPGQSSCSIGTNLCYYFPSDVSTAYTLSYIVNGRGGTGITVVIVDAYSNTQMASDLATFSSEFGLPACSVASGCLKFVNENGGSTLPGCSDTPANCQGWWTEQDLDVEWVHAVAPNAKIVVVTAESDSSSDLLTAVTTASQLGDVVSNSYGGPEFAGENATFDPVLASASVPILFSSGDQKSGEDVDYPCTSPYAVCVGGTHLLSTSASTRNMETPWGEGSGNGGAGGACSTQEPQPAYQAGYATVCGAFRGAPDVSFIADPYTGVVTYVGSNASGNAPGLYVVGGTSLATPVFAGIVANIDSARLAASKTTFGNNLNALLYQAVTAPYYRYRMYDVTSGSNNFSSAGTGWDTASGLGVPLGPALSAYLVSLP